MLKTNQMPAFSNTAKSILRPLLSSAIYPHLFFLPLAVRDRR